MALDAHFHPILAGASAERAWQARPSANSKMRTTNALIIVFVCIVALWLFHSATSACDPRDLALVSTESSTATFTRADSNSDGQLSRTEFAVAAAELRAGFASAASRAESLRGGELPAAELPAGQRPAVGALLAPAAEPASASPVSPAARSGLPQCSILIFWHVVKTAGTTMRTVLQRQAQLGEFECAATARAHSPAPRGRLRHAWHACARRDTARPSHAKVHLL